MTWFIYLGNLPKREKRRKRNTALVSISLGENLDWNMEWFRCYKKIQPFGTVSWCCRCLNRPPALVGTEALFFPYIYSIKCLLSFGCYLFIFLFLCFGVCNLYCLINRNAGSLDVQVSWDADKTKREKCL